MKRYKVNYSIYNAEYPKHIDNTEVIEAESLDNAKEIVENRSNYELDFYVNHIELVES